ncbi:MAG: PEP-CTERM sorting domain-containing protein [Pyrinomonadaceae bacterium]
MPKTRLTMRLALLFACLVCSALAARADSVTLNTSTSLLDGTHFTAGRTYYVVFQLAGGGTDNNNAVVSNFNFGGGAMLARDPADPSFGTFAVAPNPADPTGLGQAGASLQLLIIPGDALSLFSQRLVSGSSFSFDFLLSNNFTPGNSFDSFTFQLYDADLSTLLYEQQFDITGAPQPTPEPAALLLFGSGLTGLGTMLRRHRKTLARATAASRSRNAGDQSPLKGELVRLA